MQVTWDNPEQLETYIRKLQTAADRLTSENRRLRKCHGILIDKVRRTGESGENCIFKSLSLFIFIFRKL